MPEVINNSPTPEFPLPTIFIEPVKFNKPAFNANVLLSIVNTPETVKELVAKTVKFPIIFIEAATASVSIVTGDELETIVTASFTPGTTPPTHVFGSNQ